MEKNKGFTLVELIAVITILGLIAIMTTPIVTKILRESDEDANKIQTEYILEAGKVYYIDNQNNDKPDETWETAKVTLETLVNYGIIEIVENSKTENQCDYTISYVE